MMKWLKFLILLVCVVLIIFGIYFFRIKTAKVEVILNDNLEIEFNEEVKVSSFIKRINGKIIDDYIINSTKLGKKKITFQYINDDNIKVTYSFSVKVVDKTPPLVWLGSIYNFPLGSDDDLESIILCGDNYDKNPKCSIEGEYSLDEVGTYSLTYKAIDQSGNKTEQDFVLNVYEPDNKSKKNTERTNINDVIAKYKNDKTKIGIDISKWQGEVDFKKIKDAGVEFVIIRIGGTRGVGGEYFLDEKFERNIKEANKYNIDVGVYFYSYANSISSAKKDAKWIIKNIKNYKINLPIAFDWEDWNNFNSYNVSFYDLTNIAKSFMSEIEKNGYDTMLYSSKNYLEKIWLKGEYDTWLAHYTEQTNYQGKYKFWQLCENGLVDGIDGDVDIDIMYK